jgi:ABC-type multidrug transport system permease subunit
VSNIARVIVLIKKNLMRFYRNPKTIGFLILIPIIYYLLLGFIFGEIDFGDTTLTYNIGWVDNDSTKADYEIHPQFNLDTIYNITNNIEGIRLFNYSSLQEAKEASLDGDIISYIYFPNGFEEYLEKNSYIKIAFWNNDSSISVNYSISAFYNQLISITTSIFKFTNVSSSEANDILANFNNYTYDGFLILNQNFAKGLDNSWNVNMSYLYRNGTSQTKNLYVTDTLQTLANAYFQILGSTSNITIPIEFNYEILNSSPIEPIRYEIYFLQTVSPVVKSTLENIIVQVISEIINNNPIEIDLDYEVKSTVGHIVNSITFSASGYLLYGPLTILSFALITLTSEKKEGIFRRLASTEVKNWELILSNIISNIILVFMQFSIGASILWIFGWDPIIFSSFDAIFGVIITIFLFSFLILALAFALAPVFKVPETAGGGVWIIILPLAMVSGIFVPIELFGEWMKKIAAWLPTRFAVVALQNLLLNGLPLNNHETLLNLGFLTLYSTIIFLIGIRAFNKFKT